MAARCGHADIVDLLLKAGADPTLWNSWHDQPLHSACRFGQHAVVKVLIAAAVPLNLLNVEQRTPLM